MEIIKVTQPEVDSLFTIGFWLECEREAGRILRAMTDLDGQHVGRPATAPAQSVGSPRPLRSPEARPGTSAQAHEGVHRPPVL